MKTRVLVVNAQGQKLSERVVETDNDAAVQVVLAGDGTAPAIATVDPVYVAVSGNNVTGSTVQNVAIGALSADLKVTEGTVTVSGITFNAGDQYNFVPPYGFKLPALAFTGSSTAKYTLVVMR